MPAPGCAKRSAMAKALRRSWHRAGHVFLRPCAVFARTSHGVVGGSTWLRGSIAMQEESIFIAALEKEDAAERAAFLDQACAGDEALRQRIERLLRRHEQPDSLLDAPA